MTVEWALGGQRPGRRWRYMRLDVTLVRSPCDEADGHNALLRAY